MKSLADPSLTATIAILALSCTSSLPSGNEKNLAFDIDRNQLVLEQLTIDGHEGRFVAGSIHEQTLVDETFADRHDLAGQSSAMIMVSSTWHERTDIRVVDMGEEIDAIVGSDLLGPVIAIDYRNQLITRFTHAPDELEQSKIHRWRATPSYPLKLAGKVELGVIDLASPDTLTVPSSLLEGYGCERCRVDVEIGGVHFDDLDILRADVEDIRIGNRVLERFLVVIDYRNRKTTLMSR